MHEYSIVASLIETAEARAREHRATSIHRVAVQIGELSGVDPELLASAFELAREGTMCDGATIDIERVAAKWVCRACGAPIATGDVLRCGACAAPGRLVSGDEILLAQMDLEVVDV